MTQIQSYRLPIPRLDRLKHTVNYCHSSMSARFPSGIPLVSDQQELDYALLEAERAAQNLLRICSGLQLKYSNMQAVEDLERLRCMTYVAR